MFDKIICIYNFRIFQVRMSHLILKSFIDVKYPFILKITSQNPVEGGDYTLN